MPTAARFAAGGWRLQHRRGRRAVRQTFRSPSQRLLAVPHLLEVVIVNDCSTDCTGTMAEELARLLWRGEEDRQGRRGGVL